MKRLPEQIGANVQHFRRAAGVTQKKLAAACGVDEKYVSRIERGHRAPSWEVVEKIARFLKVEAWQLVDAERSVARDLADLRRFAEIANLSLEDRELVLALVARLRAMPTRSR